METEEGIKQYKILQESCSGYSPTKDQEFEKWDYRYGTGGLDFLVYALFDKTKPHVPYTFGPLTFMGYPFYIGHGDARTRMKKTCDFLQQKEYTLKTEWMQKIYNDTGCSYMSYTLIGKFKTKPKAALVERKIIKLLYDSKHHFSNAYLHRCEVPLQEEDYRLLMNNNYNIITTP